MKVKIIKEFRDRDDFSRVYSVGEEVSFSDNRAAVIIARGLAEEVKSVEATADFHKRNHGKKATKAEVQE